mmetsp:Transcript_7963/g.16738  ORF Transcript_7963/g.16738 Transcript_7963/m.16738 type:complete len:152 (+) Transcript_7963:553-1008(+)
MNLYTTNLNYNNLVYNNNNNGVNENATPYTVTDPSWKKSYIRANNGLPDLQQVIGADLDLRYLYRNRVELLLLDAAAELYSDSNTKDGYDDASVVDNTEELQQLLQEAANAFDQWLDRVRYGDVRDALQAAMKGQTTKVYDSWAAGFLPPR